MYSCWMETGNNDQDNDNNYSNDNNVCAFCKGRLSSNFANMKFMYLNIWKAMLYLIFDFHVSQM